MVLKPGERAEKARLRARIWYAENLERAQAYARKQAVENREAARQRAKDWYAANKERALQACRLYRERNLERVTQTLKKYRVENAERVSAWKRNYKIRKRGSEGSHTGEDIKNMYVAQHGKCNVCRVLLVKYHVDHIMPLILGGSNYPNNLQLLCAPCNLTKHAQHPDDFMRRASWQSP